MNEEDPDEDIVFAEREERMDRVLRETFPELNKLELIKWVEDWLFTQNDVDEYDYQKACYRRALEMFNFDHCTDREGLNDFGAFISPAIEAFFKHKPIPSPEQIKVALIAEVLDSDAKPSAKLAMLSAILDQE